MSNHIKVVCRFRPPNALEIREGAGDPIFQLDDEDTSVRLKTQESTGSFTFDRVFDITTRQEQVFEYGVRGIVDDVINGYNGTVFAYGQTGSGKTFTMMGADIDDDNLKGLVPRITEQIFHSIMTSPPNLEYLVKVSYMEIYMERIRDLLAPQNDNLQVHEEKQRGVYVKGLSDYYVGSAREVYEIMRQGAQTRATSSTNMNAESSRSHSIFVITIQQTNTETGSRKNGNLYLVDLAGSEKIGKTGASGQTLEEAKKINKSLSALGMVINALTDGKSSHIPYRDSKLTRILQESLGGNSRTTLIINCSPSLYNEAETISTLRFGVRAKSIKNKARVNAELSPQELRAFLKKAQRDLANAQSYISSLEEEINVWRNGGKVDKAAWASMDKAIKNSNAKDGSSALPPSSSSTGATSTTASSTTTKSLASGMPSAAAASSATTPSSGSSTPTPPLTNPALDRLGELESRPATPFTPPTLEKDEREEFLKRESELLDQVAEKEAALAQLDKSLVELRDELSFYKEQEHTLSNDNKSMSAELNEVKLQLERLAFENKETMIMLDAMKEQNGELNNELEETKKTLNEIKASQGFSSVHDEGKEKKKAEKLAALMGSFDGGSSGVGGGRDGDGTESKGEGGVSGSMSEKEEQIRSTLAKLDQAVVSSSSADGGDNQQSLSNSDIALLRQQLADSRNLVHEQGERMRTLQDESELISRKRDELEQRLSGLEQEYEELLERNFKDDGSGNGGEQASADAQDLKNKLQAQYAAKRDQTLKEMSELKAELEAKTNENKKLNVTVESLKGANEELKRAFAVTTAGIEGGQNLAESAKEMERIRKTMATQLSDFDTMKKALMRDLQDRCEKVVELEISLDETREQYNNVLRNSNSKTQQRKMEFLTRNLDQLTLVQRQLVEQNTSLKKDVAIAERKLVARRERIQSLETLLAEAQKKLNVQNAKFEEQMQAVRERLEQAKATRPTGGTSSTFSFGRIAKPLRGGGGMVEEPAGGAGTTVDRGNNNPKPVSSRTSWLYTSS